MEGVQGPGVSVQLPHLVILVGNLSSFKPSFCPEEGDTTELGGLEH